MKRTLCFISAVCMLFSAVSCRKNGNTQSASPKNTASQAQYVKSDKSYHLRKLSMPSDSASVISAAPLGNGKFIAAFRNPESIVPVFYTTDESFSTYTPCNTQISFRDNAEITLRFANAADGTLYMAVTEITHGDMPPFNYMDPEQNDEDFNWNSYNSSAEYFYTVYRISDSGIAISKTEITGMSNYSIDDFTICDRRFYFSCGNVYTADMVSGQAEEYKPAQHEASGSLGVTSDDVLICGLSREFDSLLAIGDELLSLEKSGSPVSHISGGGNDFNAVFTGKTGIYGLKNNTITELALNIQLGINENSTDEIIPAENGYILSVFNQNNAVHNLYLLTDTPEDDAPQEPVTLKLGVMYQNEDFMNHVADFNRSGKNITINPVYYTDYDIYDKEKDEQVCTGTEQLSMDLITGDGPDISVFMNTPLDFMGKDIFTDMYSLMDDELSRDMILPNILEACEYDEKLYSLPTCFTVRSMIIKEKFSLTENQTFEEMLDTIGNAPAEMNIINNGSKIEMFISLLTYSDYAVSCKDGRYFVNTGNMEKLLEFCNKFPDYPEEISYDMSRDEVLFCEFAATGFGDFRTYYDIAAEPVTFAGYPSLNREGSTVVMNCNVAIMEKCSSKKEAWEFVKSIYTGENSSITNGRNMELPILTKDIEQLAEIAENNGNFTRDELEQAIRVIKGAKRASNGLPNDLFRIISEESQPYFAGECSAADAAYYIKNRTDIYISENE
ncbi:MAG: extracellular solute-binding protein [Ruminococcus sp.]|nr:extracellular solute-binding protein [Ruminococcus sp.]